MAAAIEFLKIAVLLVGFRFFFFLAFGYWLFGQYDVNLSTLVSWFFFSCLAMENDSGLGLCLCFSVRPSTIIDVIQFYLYLNL